MLLASWFQDVFRLFPCSKVADSPSSGRAELHHGKLAGFFLLTAGFASLVCCCCYAGFRAALVCIWCQDAFWLLASMIIVSSNYTQMSRFWKLPLFHKNDPLRSRLFLCNGLEVMIGLKVHVRPHRCWRFSPSGTVTGGRVTWPLMSPRWEACLGSVGLA